jgi:hypothetical protein
MPSSLKSKAEKYFAVVAVTNGTDCSRSAAIYVVLNFSVRNKV